jgi:hypothetical protein
MGYFLAVWIDIVDWEGGRILQTVGNLW